MLNLLSSGLNVPSLYSLSVRGLCFLGREFVSSWVSPNGQCLSLSAFLSTRQFSGLVQNML